MIIQCPQCQSEHELVEDSVVDQEEKVVCQNCERVIPVKRPQVDNPASSLVESVESAAYNRGDEAAENKAGMFSIGDVSPLEGPFDDLPDLGEENISEGLQTGPMDVLAIGGPSSPADTIGSAPHSEELVSLSAEENLESLGDDPASSMAESVESTAYNTGDEAAENKAGMVSIGDVSPSEGHFDDLPDLGEENISEGLQTGPMDVLAIGGPSSPADTIGSTPHSEELMSLSAEKNLESLGDDPAYSMAESAESTAYNTGDEAAENKAGMFSIGDVSPSEGHFDNLPELGEENISEGSQAGLKDEVPAAKEQSSPAGNIGADQYSEDDGKLRIKEEQERKARKSPGAGLKGEMIGSPIKIKPAFPKIIVPAIILILCLSVLSFRLFTDSSFTLYDLQSYYVDRGKTGKAFVISGKVKNDASPPKNFIQLKGKIVGPHDKVLAEKDVYCGNTLTREELSRLPQKEIEKRLQTKVGKALANFNIYPSQSVPFMIVFFDVPEDVVNFYTKVIHWQKSSG